MTENFIQKTFDGDKERFLNFALGIKSEEQLVSILQEEGITRKIEVFEIVGAVKKVGSFQGTFLLLFPFASCNISFSLLQTKLNPQ